MIGVSGEFLASANAPEWRTSQSPTSSVAVTSNKAWWRAITAPPIYNPDVWTADEYAALTSLIEEAAAVPGDDRIDSDEERYDRADITSALFRHQTDSLARDDD